MGTASWPPEPGGPRARAARRRTPAMRSIRVSLVAGTCSRASGDNDLLLSGLVSRPSVTLYSSRGRGGGPETLRPFRSYTPLWQLQKMSALACAELDGAFQVSAYRAEGPSTSSSGSGTRITRQGWPAKLNGGGQCPCASAFNSFTRYGGDHLQCAGTGRRPRPKKPDDRIEDRPQVTATLARRPCKSQFRLETGPGVSAISRPFRGAEKTTDLTGHHAYRATYQTSRSAVNTSIPQTARVFKKHCNNSAERSKPLVLRHSERSEECGLNCDGGQILRCAQNDGRLAHGAIALSGNNTIYGMLSCENSASCLGLRVSRGRKGFSVWARWGERRKARCTRTTPHLKTESALVRPVGRLTNAPH